MGDTKNPSQKKLLYEVSIIWPIVIFLLGLLHSLRMIANEGISNINCGVRHVIAFDQVDIEN